MAGGVDQKRCVGVRPALIAINPIPDFLFPVARMVRRKAVFKVRIGKICPASAVVNRPRLPDAIRPCEGRPEREADHMGIPPDSRRKIIRIDKISRRSGREIPISPVDCGNYDDRQTAVRRSQQMVKVVDFRRIVNVPRRSGDRTRLKKSGLG
ncbi:hypothetical protein SDC9_207730 [bioreactor metagenome]|uniref:Uncharacterized protein n=1 Tax=bioreactor metagenome TaxID=1076179 RepID=A0A645J9D4_9ZZZZ